MSTLGATMRARAGERAMLERPSLVSFAGPCALAAPTHAPPHEMGEQEIGDEEPRTWRASPDELRLDDERAAPSRVEDFTAGIVASAAETMSMLAEHRFTRPLALRATREERILKLADAIFATGDHAIADVLGWWEGARGNENAWAIWPPVFMLGLVDGPDGLLAIERLLDALRPEQSDAVLVVANALSAVPHPGRFALAENLLESQNAIARAVGLEVLSRGGLLDVEHAARHLDARAPALLAAAIRAVARVETKPPIERVLPLLAHRDGDVAWEAARAVTLWRAPDALRAVREGGSLSATLGRRAMELFVMAGEADDITHVETIVAGSTMTSEVLDAIARFGHPLAWSFLLHYVADAELAEAAADALQTLFGAIVPPDMTRRPSAWRAALEDRDLDPSLRYRLGEPWTPALVMRDCAIEGSGSRRAVERQLDEIAARTGAFMNIDLGVWTTPEANAALLSAIDSARRAPWKPGAWTDARARAQDRRTR